MITQAKTKNTTIRRDLFAIKVFDYVDAHRSEFVVTEITSSIDTARQMVRSLRMDTHRPFPLVKPKVVHPPQWLVNAYLAYGNQIVS